MTQSAILHDDAIDNATASASGLVASSLAAYGLDLSEYTLVEWAAAGTKYFTVDAGAGVAVNSIGIAGHNFYQADADVSLEYSSDNFSGDINEALAAFTPGPGPVLKTFPSQTARYWRMKVVTASVAASFAVLKLGQLLPIPAWLPDEYDPMPEATVFRGQVLGGQLINRPVAYHEITVAPSWQRLLPTWITNTWAPAWRSYIGLGLPFFFAFDLSGHPDDVLYARVQEGARLAAPWQKGTRSLTLPMTAIRDWERV